MLPLIACAPETFNADCGILISYSSVYQEKIAIELKGLKDSNQYPNTLELINDYKVTRDSIRACQKVK